MSRVYRKLKVKYIVLLLICLYLVYFIISSWDGNYILKSMTQPADENIREKRLPDAIIIGAAKAGTSVLKRNLLLHPDVKGRKYEEIRFFNRYFEKGLPWYIEQMEPVTRDEIAIEKTNYFSYRNAIQRIWQVFGNNIKLILIVRDPVQRLISNYAMMFENKVINGTFKKLTFTEINGKLTVNAKYYNVQNSYYAKWLNMWLDTGFKLSTFMIIDGDEFAKDPLPELIKLEQFLGLRHMLTKETFYFNETKGFPCVAPNFTFADGTKSNVKGGCAEEKCGRKHPDVPFDQLELLYQHFAPLNQEFFDLVGMDIPDWNMKKTVKI